MKYTIETVSDEIEFGKRVRETIKSKTLEQTKQWAKEKYTEEQLWDVMSHVYMEDIYKKILTKEEYEEIKNTDLRLLHDKNTKNKLHKDISSRFFEIVDSPPSTFPCGLDKLWVSLQTEQELKDTLLEACAKGDMVTVNDLIDLNDSIFNEPIIENKSIWSEAFFAATKANHLETAKKLMFKIDYTCTDESGTSALEYIVKDENRVHMMHILGSMIYENPNHNIPQKDPTIQKKVKETIEKALNTAKKLWDGTGYSSKDEKEMTRKVMKGVIDDAAAEMGGTLGGMESRPSFHSHEKDKRKGIIYDLERFLGFEVPFTMLGMVYNVSDPSSGEGEWVDKLSKLKPPKVGSAVPPFTVNERGGKAYHAAIHGGFSPTTGFEEMIETHRKRSGWKCHLYQPCSNDFTFDDITIDPQTVVSQSSETNIEPKSKKKKSEEPTLSM